MSSRKNDLAHSEGTWALGAALDQSAPLTSLLQRLQQSQARFNAIRSHLPDGLRDHVRPGPLDDTGWSLMVRSGSMAAKLRQLTPALEQALLAQGWQALPIRIRVQSS